MGAVEKFSSLSESGFIPTVIETSQGGLRQAGGSHLFQRVASFLPDSLEAENEEFLTKFSSLSESGFIPTYYGN